MLLMKTNYYNMPLSDQPEVQIPSCAPLDAKDSRLPLLDFNGDILRNQGLQVVITRPIVMANRHVPKFTSGQHLQCQIQLLLNAT